MYPKAKIIWKETAVPLITVGHIWTQRENPELNNFLSNKFSFIQLKLEKAY